ARGFLLRDWTVSAVRRLLGVDRERLSPVSRISTAAGKPGRIQRKIYEQSNGAAWRVVRHPRRPYSRELPQFLPARDAVAVFRDPSGIVTGDYGELWPRKCRNWPSIGFSNPAGIHKEKN